MNKGTIKIRTDKLMDKSRRLGPPKNNRTHIPKHSNMTNLRRILYNLRGSEDLTVIEEGEFTTFKYTF